MPMVDRLHEPAASLRRAPMPPDYVRHAEPSYMKVIGRGPFA
jgi:hypothetical protein